ncbi:PQQ-binding-like beta-propeller repeat protein [Lacipirellula sp.]|uniref:outer membrane protein assembly factor BamB family protein n=1 Tax=Lacipirellula sp. TaxID=2691419 RepID=UPI003D138453
MTRVILASVLVIAMQTRGQAEWSQFQGNSSHTGYASGNFDAEHFTQKWNLRMTLATDVAVQGNALYVTQVGTKSSRVATVSRIDASSGDVQWSTKLPYRSPNGVSAPSVQGDNVYVHRWGHSSISGSTDPNDQPALVGLSAADGKQLFATQHSGQWYSGSRPTIDGDAIFSSGGYYGGLDAYDTNGTHRWFAELNLEDGWIPAADSQNVYAYLEEAGTSPGPYVGRLYIADRQTGSWRAIVHPRSVGFRTTITDDGSVMLDGSGNAYALSRITGSSALVSFNTVANNINWEADGFWSDNPAMNNGVIALPEGQSLVFLDANTGVRQWSWAHSAKVVGNVVLTDSVAFVNTDTGIHAIDLVSRTSVWSTPVSGRIALSDGVLYVVSNEGIFAFGAVPEPASGIVMAIAFGMVVSVSRLRNSS